MTEDSQQSTMYKTIHVARWGQSGTNGDILIAVHYDNPEGISFRASQAIDVRPTGDQRGKWTLFDITLSVPQSVWDAHLRERVFQCPDCLDVMDEIVHLWWLLNVNGPSIETTDRFSLSHNKQGRIEM